MGVLGNPHRRGWYRIGSVYTRLLFGIAVACCLLPVTSHTSHAAEILTGMLNDVRGDVKIRRAGSELERPAVSGQRVEPGDAVITGASGRVTLKFEHGEVELDNATRVTLLRAMTSRDEVFAELALTAGSAEAYINMGKRKELWFDILTPTQLARGQGSKKGQTHLLVSHAAGGTTTTDGEIGRWQYQPIILPDLPPAVQAVLMDNAKASTLVKTYMSAALSDSALVAYEVVSNSGAPDISVVQTPTTSPADTAEAKTPAALPAPEPPRPAAPPVVSTPPPKPPLKLTLTPEDERSAPISNSSTVTSEVK